ncbi:MAG: hypothetical protein ACSW8E_04865 [Clostridia bacterium]
MKRVSALILLLALMLSLAACGSAPVQETDEDVPKLTSVLPGSSQKAPAAEPTEAPKATPAPVKDAKSETSETVARILRMKGQPVKDLIDLVGEPISREYSSSCLIEGGQDGQLIYEGFIVYTLVQKDGTETIYDCE